MCMFECLCVCMSVYVYACVRASVWLVYQLVFGRTYIRLDHKPLVWLALLGSYSMRVITAVIPHWLRQGTAFIAVKWSLQLCFL